MHIGSYFRVYRRKRYDKSVHVLVEIYTAAYGSSYFLQDALTPQARRCRHVLTLGFLAARAEIHIGYAARAEILLSYAARALRCMQVFILGFLAASAETDDAILPKVTLVIRLWGRMAQQSERYASTGAEGYAASAEMHTSIYFRVSGRKR